MNAYQNVSVLMGGKQTWGVHKFLLKMWTRINFVLTAFNSALKCCWCRIEGKQFQIYKACIQAGIK